MSKMAKKKQGLIILLFVVLSAFGLVASSGNLYDAVGALGGVLFLAWFLLNKLKSDKGETK